MELIFYILYNTSSKLYLSGSSKHKSFNVDAAKARKFSTISIARSCRTQKFARTAIWEIHKISCRIDNIETIEEID